MIPLQFHRFRAEMSFQTMKKRREESLDLFTLTYFTLPVIQGSRSYLLAYHRNIVNQSVFFLFSMCVSVPVHFNKNMRCIKIQVSSILVSFLI